MAGASDVLCVLLAGGQGRRLGVADKALAEVRGRSLIARAIDRLRPQAAAILINANGDASRFSAFGLPVAGDAIAGLAGPLAGVLTGLEYARDRMNGVEAVATLAADTPFAPFDYVTRLVAARAEWGADIAVAASLGRRHHVDALWPVALAPALRAALAEEGLRKVEAFANRYRRVEVEWSAEPCDPFFNVNTPGDIREAETLALRLDL